MEDYYRIITFGYFEEKFNEIQSQFVYRKSLNVYLVKQLLRRWQHFTRSTLFDKNKTILMKIQYFRKLNLLSPQYIQ